MRAETNSLSLSQLLDQVELALKGAFASSVWIMAEILELHVNQRGHCYLELIEKNKENDAILARSRATIWASKFGMLKPYFETTTGMPLKGGIKILCRASVEFHPVYGFSLNISDIDPAYTLGDLARKKQEVIRRLRDEGVMEMNRELPFPLVPQHIAVISSETAAGYGDFMDSLLNNSQGYQFHTRLFKAIMQGDEAPGSIIQALDAIHSSRHPFDCVVLIRGGGSRSDLECFNDYELAYYITQFPIPVLTGIGHERDESVADLVASRGLKTPTAVAEYLLETLLSFEFRLSSYMDQLSSLVNKSVNDQRLRLERMTGRITYLSKAFLDKAQERLSRADENFRREVLSLLAREKEFLNHTEAKKELVNPVNVLKRGYSMTLHQGKVLSDIEGIEVNEILETRLYRGSILSKVEKTNKRWQKKK